MIKQNFQLLLLTVFLLGGTSLWGQKTTVSGTVKDAENGEDLIGATVFVKEIPGKGAYSNEYGFYSLTLPEGNYTLVFRYVGYTNLEKAIELNESQTINVELDLEGKEMDVVEITAEREDENVQSTEMSVATLTPKEVENIPVLFGEKDIVKTLQLLPGIKSAGEGNAGFYVRGGGADQNLILLDEAPVYNASHLLGFFSVFNSDALKDVKLYKGGMPAEYGGRVSSVMDVRMKDGNKKKLGISGGIGLISSRLTVEAPIVKDKGSFIVSGRRTYADLFLKFSSDEDLRNTSLYFYDLNAKANYQIGEKDRIFASGYFGRDNFNFADNFGFDWGNATGTLRWNHLFNERLFSNTSLIYSNYNYEFKIGDEDSGFGLRSEIEDWNFKEDITWFPNSDHTMKFGVNVIHHNFVPGELTAAPGVSISSFEVDERRALESAAYVQDDWRISDRLSANFGLRYSMFNNIGEGKAYTFDDEGNVLTETQYDAWEVFKTQSGFEPRASFRYLLDENSSIKAAYNRNYQYIHLLSNSLSTSPTDVYVPSSNVVKPQIADQFAIGYFRNFADDKYEFSAETYYKVLQNQIDYRNGADLFLNNTVESELVFGNGRSYGLEVLLKKRTGKLTGWLSYTLSRTLRTFDDINDGAEFPARQDRIHDLSLTVVYQLSPKVVLSGNFIYYTGDAVTFPSGRYEVEGIQVPLYTERNGYRLPSYHRMDLGATFQLKETEKFKSNLNVSLYNAYGRQNPFIINFQESESNPGTTEAVQLSLFRWIPSLTYNFEF